MGPVSALCFAAQTDPYDTWVKAQAMFHGSRTSAASRCRHGQCRAATRVAASGHVMLWCHPTAKASGLGSVRLRPYRAATAPPSGQVLATVQ